MRKKVRILYSAVSWILLAALVLLAALLVLPRFFGFEIFAVLSPSMEPAYHTGDAVYVRPQPPEEIRVGMPLTFLLNDNTAATHRVIEVLEDPQAPGALCFRTKGDANQAADGRLVHARDILGVPEFSIPVLGYLAYSLQSPPGRYLTWAAAAVVLLLLILPEFFRREEKQSKQPSEKEKISLERTEENEQTQ